jgi:hypothetical protein
VCGYDPGGESVRLVTFVARIGALDPPREEDC